MTERMRRGSEEGGPRLGLVMDKEADRFEDNDCAMIRDVGGTTVSKREEVRGRMPFSLTRWNGDAGTGWLGLREWVREGPDLATGLGL